MRCLSGNQRADGGQVVGFRFNFRTSPAVLEPVGEMCCLGDLHVVGFDVIIHDAQKIFALGKVSRGLGRHAEIELDLRQRDRRSQSVLENEVPLAHLIRFAEIVFSQVFQAVRIIVVGLLQAIPGTEADLVFLVFLSAQATSQPRAHLAAEE